MIAEAKTMERSQLSGWNTQFTCMRWVPEKVVLVAGRASDFNSLLSSNNVSFLTREEIPWLRTGINSVEYKWKHVV